MQPNNQNIPRNTFRNRPRQTVENRPADGSGTRPAGNYTRPEPPESETPDLLRQIRAAIRQYPILNTIYVYSIRAFIWLFLGSIGWVILLKYIPVWVTPLVVTRKLDAMGEDKSAKVYKKWRSLDEISKEAALAVVASEDQQFPVHWGFDFDEIQDAIKENKTRKRPRGASTISQQVAKNVFLWNGRSYIRKGLEVYFTVLIELIWGKKRILEVYLNVAETGPLTFGVEAASQRYYGHTAKLLSRDEAARIAAVLPNPIKFSIQNPSGYVLRRTRQISRQMRALGGQKYLKNL
nr:monofunctional biosynthetic peptidoglycan transglycosylase [uncultured Arsenicibacter sp.]